MATATVASSVWNTLSTIKMDFFFFSAHITYTSLVHVTASIIAEGKAMHTVGSMCLPLISSTVGKLRVPIYKATSFYLLSRLLEIATLLVKEGIDSNQEVTLHFSFLFSIHLLRAFPLSNS
jgi:hypothetical protein